MTKRRPLPPVEYLKECFELDSNCPSGLRWKERPLHHFKNENSQMRMNSAYSGKPAGNLGRTGRYMSVGVGMKNFTAHIIVYAIYNDTNDIPEGMDVDHINRNNFDNSPENLRLISHRDNSKNRKLHKNNKAGFPHVYPNVSKKGKPTTYSVCFNLPGTSMKSFGTYKNFEDAKARAIEISLRIHGEYSPFYNGDYEIKEKEKPPIPANPYVYFRDYLLY